MTLDLLSQATFAGPAFTEPFVRYELEHELAARKLLPRETGAEGRELQASWETYRRYLRELVALGGAVRGRNRVLEPLMGRLAMPVSSRPMISPRARGRHWPATMCAGPSARPLMRSSRRRMAWIARSTPTSSPPSATRAIPRRRRSVWCGLMSWRRSGWTRSRGSGIRIGMCRSMRSCRRR